jgi:hypothetical protein
MEVPKSLQDCIDEMGRMARKMTYDHAIDQLARAYSFETAGWLQAAGTPSDQDETDPRAVLAYYSALIPVKVCSALAGLEPATMALLAIDRSRAAWIEIVEQGLASVGDVQPFVSELGALSAEIERVFPTAPGHANDH